MLVNETTTWKNRDREAFVIFGTFVEVTMFRVLF